MLLLMIYQKKTNAAEIIYLLEYIDVVISIIVVVVMISPIYYVILRSRCKRDTNAKITDEKALTTDGSGRRTINFIVLSSLYCTVFR